MWRYRSHTLSPDLMISSLSAGEFHFNLPAMVPVFLSYGKIMGNQLLFIETSKNIDRSRSNSTSELSFLESYRTLEYWKLLNREGIGERQQHETWTVGLIQVQRIVFD